MLLRDLLLTGGGRGGPSRAAWLLPGRPQLFLPPASFSCQLRSPLENRGAFSTETLPFPWEN